MNLKLIPIKANMNELRLPNGAVILFSYQTPVAAQRAEGGFVRTAQHYSPTTTRHINQWLEGRKAEEVPQAEINAMVEG
jgi:hypothetical protein